MDNKLVTLAEALVCRANLMARRCEGSEESELFKQLAIHLSASLLATREACKERDASMAAERLWETTMLEACGEDGPGSVASEIRRLRELRDTALSTVRKERDSLNQQVVNLAVENASLLPQAASELSNAWMLHKYWVGIQVALMHVNAGRLHDGMTWLQNTVSGPGIEAPELSDFAEIEAWANEQQKDSIGHVRALEIIKAASPATETAIASIKVQGRIEGAHFVANRMLAAWEAGFIEDTAKNAADIARMILTSTEFMPTAPEFDFDRSFADGVLEDIAAQLRKERTHD